METSTRPAVDGDLSQAERERIYHEKYFDQCYNKHWFAYNDRTLRDRDEHFLKLLDLQPGDVVLEAGCSTGRTTRMLSRQAARVIGIDFASYAITSAQKHAQEEGLNNVTFAVDDIGAMQSVADASIDKIAAFDITEHVYDEVMRKFFVQSARVLKPGGYLCIYTPNLNYFVERMKQRNFIIKQFESHIAVRNWKHYRRLLEESGAPFSIGLMYHSTSSYPGLKHVERVLRLIPWFGKLFEFRICLRLVRQ